MFITRSWLLLAVLAVGSTQNENKTCPITEDIQGECILVRKCPRAIQLIRLNDLRSLRNLTCGYDKLDPKVCCEINKTEGSIIFKNTTQEIATPRPEAQPEPTVILPPDPARPELMRPSTEATAPTRATYYYTTPYPATTQFNPKETKAEVDPVLPSTPHRGGEVAAASPTKAVPSFTNPPVVEHVIGGREPGEQSEISPALDGKPPPNLSTGSSSFGANSAPPPGVHASADILPSRSVCGLMDTSDRIFGGQLAGIDELPWLARIKYLVNGKESYACHGSLVTDRFILTAAHCVSLQKIIEVRLGEWDIDTEVDCVQGDCSDPPVDVKVEQAFVHPSYNRRMLVGDIALLRLATPVNFTEFIQPICLPTTDYVARQDYDLDNDYLTGGWGKTEYEYRSIVKRKVKLSPVAMGTCRVALNRISDELAVSSICAGGRRGADSCAGDSGSSLVKQARENGYINWYIYGITSFGPKECGIEGYPGVYTRTTYYMNWIMSVISSFPK